MCVYCGLRFEEEIAAQREQAETRHFVGALFVRSSPVTFLFFGINIGLFVLMWLAGGMGAMQADEEVLIGFGAKQNELIKNQREYWRLVTCVFLHIGFLHIFFNNYALWVVGQEIERLYGSARFVVLYLAAGIAASIASYYFSPTHPSAGASGALFGLFGVLGTFAFRYRKEIPGTISSAIKRRVLPLILINLVFGFSVTGIDNAAHVGGLVAGALLCLIVPYKRPGENATAVVWRALQVVSLGLILVSFGAAFRSYDGPPLRLSNLAAMGGGSNKRAEQYLKGVIAANNALEASVRVFSAIARAEDDEAQTAVPLAGVLRGLKSIDETPRLDAQCTRFRQEIFDLLNRQKEIIERHDSLAHKDWKKALESERELGARHAAVESEFGPWLSDYAKRHGFEIKPLESQ